MNIFLHCHGVAVNMERSCLFTLERHFFSAQRVHEMAVVDTSCEQTQGETGTSEDGITGHQHYIHQTVLYTRLRRDKRFVAPLVCVREGDQKRFVRQIQTVADQVVCLRLVRESILKDVLQVGRKTAFVTACKMVRYQRIKSRATRADE